MKIKTLTAAYWFTQSPRVIGLVADDRFTKNDQLMIRSATGDGEGNCLGRNLALTRAQLKAIIDSDKYIEDANDALRKLLRVMKEAGIDVII